MRFFLSCATSLLYIYNVVQFVTQSITLYFIHRFEVVSWRVTIKIECAPLMNVYTINRIVGEEERNCLSVGLLGGAGSDPYGVHVDVIGADDGEGVFAGA